LKTIHNKNFIIYSDDNIIHSIGSLDEWLKVLKPTHAKYIITAAFFLFSHVLHNIFEELKNTLPKGGVIYSNENYFNHIENKDENTIFVCSVNKNNLLIKFDKTYYGIPANPVQSDKYSKSISLDKEVSLSLMLKSHDQAIKFSELQQAGKDLSTAEKIFDCIKNKYSIKLLSFYQNHYEYVEYSYNISIGNITIPLKIKPNVTEDFKSYSQSLFEEIEKTLNKIPFNKFDNVNKVIKNILEKKGLYTETLSTVPALVTPPETPVIQTTPLPVIPAKMEFEIPPEYIMKTPVEMRYEEAFIKKYKEAEEIQLSVVEERPTLDFVMPYINHVNDRITELEKLLKKNKKLRIVIPGPENRGSKDIRVKHHIGTGIAVDQWVNPDKEKKQKDVNYLKAWWLYIEYITNKFEKLIKDYNNEGQRISYGTLDRKLASEDVIMVWGANSANVVGNYGEEIVGRGQALAMQRYGPGVFGIISTPSEGRPREISYRKTKQTKLSFAREKYLKYKLKYHHLKKMLINN
jgi:hypothetical protein